MLSICELLCSHTHSVHVAPDDYTSISINRVRYRGGRNQDALYQFSVTIASDDEEEEEESFFITYVPTTNGLIIPPTTEIRICGGKRLYTLE